ncbi:hypothetical protein IKG12_00780 [Candidatus Saccharibacteria bacterium]|nr:hypothetical protein [Candidatus Saccharibacteria bacterium]
MTGASLGYSGNYNGNALRDVGTNGVWWSSTISDAIYSRYLSTFAEGGISPQIASYKLMGRAVRCLSVSPLLLRLHRK